PTGTATSTATGSARSSSTRWRSRSADACDPPRRRSWSWATPTRWGRPWKRSRSGPWRSAARTTDPRAVRMLSYSSRLDRPIQRTDVHGIERPCGTMPMARALHLYLATMTGGLPAWQAAANEEVHVARATAERKRDVGVGGEAKAHRLHLGELNDSEVVQASLDGDPRAFGQLV